MEINKNAPVLVTGATGYVAGWIVKKLLEDGVHVRASVRDKSKPGKFEHLTKIAKQASGELEIVEADLLEIGSFDNAAEGCELIIHTASPFKFMGLKDPQKELVDPAVNGTKNVLGAASKSSSVKRVVLTSSVVSIYGDAIDVRQTENGIFDESHWNTTSSIDHQPYSYSKVQAERVAWKVYEQQNQWDLVVINPGFVLGPSLTSRNDSTSIEYMINLTDGTFKMGVPELYYTMVDVRNIAEAHIRAGFNPNASGRHIVVNETVEMLEMAKQIERDFPGKFKTPRKHLPKFLALLFGPLQGITRDFVRKNVGIHYEMKNDKSKQQLDINYIPWQQTLNEHVEQLLADNLIKSK